MQLILLGPPGAGKGTQAEMLKGLGLAHISTGEMFREALASGSEVGVKANQYMSTGALVPDDIVIGIVKERLEKPDALHGFILDGFPRTIAQAEALGVLLEKINRPISAVIELCADEDELVERLSGRRVCSKCSQGYHVVNVPPVTEGICDKCGGELIQRGDDKPEAIRERLSVYHQKTAPLTNYYKEQGTLLPINASGSVEAVFGAIQSSLKTVTA
jgi:adenylate kinase